MVKKKWKERERERDSKKGKREREKERCTANTIWRHNSTLPGKYIYKVRWNPLFPSTADERPDSQSKIKNNGYVLKF